MLPHFDSSWRPFHTRTHVESWPHLSTAMGSFAPSNFTSVMSSISPAPIDLVQTCHMTAGFRKSKSKLHRSQTSYSSMHLGLANPVSSTFPSLPSRSCRSAFLSHVSCPPFLLSFHGQNQLLTVTKNTKTVQHLEHTSTCVQYDITIM